MGWPSRSLMPPVFLCTVEWTCGQQINYWVYNHVVSYDWGVCLKYTIVDFSELWTAVNICLTFCVSCNELEKANFSALCNLHYVLDEEETWHDILKHTKTKLLLKVGYVRQLTFSKGSNVMNNYCKKKVVPFVCLVQATKDISSYVWNSMLKISSLVVSIELLSSV